MLALVYAFGIERRMEREYRERDAFTPATVGLLYSAYAVTGGTLLAAVRHRPWPLPLPAAKAQLVGGAIIVAGAATCVLGVSRFGSAAQLSGVEAGDLATGGVYRHTRNPQYLGLSAAAAGVATAGRDGLALAIAAAVFRIFVRWIPNEEQHLQRVFGEQYLAYASRVPRWLSINHARHNEGATVSESGREKGT